MPLSSSLIALHLEGTNPDGGDLFYAAPCPDTKVIREQGSASIDLRLGTWFVMTKASRHSLLDVYSDSAKQPSEHNLTDKHYVPLGRHFILHPHSFVLAATLEWIRMPKGYCGYVNGKSSWGRRGLIIETAPGVHPGFAGCLTLELTNVGGIPIKLVTGTTICQLFLHRVSEDTATENPRKVDQSSFLGQRQPRLGKITPDNFVRALMTSQDWPGEGCDENSD